MSDTLTISKEANERFLMQLNASQSYDTLMKMSANLRKMRMSAREAVKSASKALAEAVDTEHQLNEMIGMVDEALDRVLPHQRQLSGR